jgi:hypothetical protein
MTWAPAWWVVGLALVVGPARAEEKKSRAAPQLKSAPKIDGDLADWRGALELAGKARVGVFGTSLYFGATVDGPATTEESWDVSLFFPGAGPTAHGFVFRIGRDGVRRSEEEGAAPMYAQQLVEAADRPDPRGNAIEAAFPVRALPSFPLRGPLAMELCVTFRKVQTCSSLRLPEGLRAAARVKPPQGVVAVEGRANGWVGYGARHELRWLYGDEPLTAASLAGMVTEQPLTPEDIGMATPNLVLHGRKPIFFVLSGKDPQPGEGRCDAAKEVRLSLYLVEGRAGVQVLECPAVTCALGRATAVVLDDEGSLSIGYSGGSIANYSWSTDHFERTEYGMLSP